jgi:hypothetical protein
MNVPQAFDKCHRSDPCLNWMKMKPGWFLCEKVCQTQPAYVFLEEKVKKLMAVGNLLFM